MGRLRSRSGRGRGCGGGCRCGNRILFSRAGRSSPLPGRRGRRRGGIRGFPPFRRFMHIAPLTGFEVRLIPAFSLQPEDCGRHEPLERRPMAVGAFLKGRVAHFLKRLGYLTTVLTAILVDRHGKSPPLPVTRPGRDAPPARVQHGDPNPPDQVPARAQRASACAMK